MTYEEMEKAYREDEEFRTYVDAYAKGMQISISEALRHKTVEYVLLHYVSRRK